MLTLTLSSRIFSAELINEEQHLDFGEFAANFSVSSNLQISPNGTVMTSGPLYVLNVPQAARIRLSGYPANQALTISIDDFFLVRSGGDKFLVSDFILSTQATDANGDALLLIGATLNIDGGKTYIDTNYSGNMIVNISYP